MITYITIQNVLPVCNRTFLHSQKLHRFHYDLLEKANDLRKKKCGPAFHEIFTRVFYQ